MTDSRPDRPSARVPAATCCQQARNRTKSAMLAPARPGAADGPGWRRASAPADGGRTSDRREARWPSRRPPGGPDRSGPGPRSPAPRGRDPLGSGRVGHQLLHGHRAGQARDARPRTRPAPRRRRPSGRSASRGSPPPRPGARWRPSAPSTTGPAVGRELVEPRAATRHRSAQDQRQQQVVQLVGVPRPGPDLVEHLGHGGRIEGGRARDGGHRQSGGSPSGRAPRAPGAPARPGCAAPPAVRRRGR